MGDAELNQQAREEQCKNPKAPEAGQVQGTNNYRAVSGSESKVAQLRKET